jgi:hypothetical protein
MQLGDEIVALLINLFSAFGVCLSVDDELEFGVVRRQGHDAASRAAAWFCVLSPAKFLPCWDGRSLCLFGCLSRKSRHHQSCFIAGNRAVDKLRGGAVTLSWQ